MTGLDCLRDEMKKRGMTKSQIESNVVAVMLDILANSENKYSEMWRTEAHETERLKEIRKDIRSEEWTLGYLKRERETLEKEVASVKEQRKHCEDYIESFYKSLEKCETQEGRDALRSAQMFINTVNINSKYDNTAFIIGLASILSKGGINAIAELEKINKKLPTIKEWEEVQVR